jgi:hypothetical protein
VTRYLPARSDSRPLVRGTTTCRSVLSGCPLRTLLCDRRQTWIALPCPHSFATYRERQPADLLCSPRLPPPPALLLLPNAAALKTHQPGPISASPLVSAPSSTVLDSIGSRRPPRRNPVAAKLLVSPSKVTHHSWLDRRALYLLYTKSAAPEPTTPTTQPPLRFLVRLCAVRSNTYLTWQP